MKIIKSFFLISFFIFKINYFILQNKKVKLPNNFEFKFEKLFSFFNFPINFTIFVFTTLMVLFLFVLAGFYINKANIKKNKFNFYKQKNQFKI